MMKQGKKHRHIPRQEWGKQTAIDETLPKTRPSLQKGGRPLQEEQWQDSGARLFNHCAGASR
jgi:hypothetical protein